MIASTVKDKKLAIIYRSTKAEPISIISAKEKMVLDESRPDGLCVGKPVMEETVKIISASDGVLYKIHHCVHSMHIKIPCYNVHKTSNAEAKPGHVYILIGERHSAWLLILYNYIMP